MTRITAPRQVGIVVTSARRAKGITQSQLAHDANVSRQLVNRLEMGTATGIALDKLLAILDAAGCTLDISSLAGEEAPGEAPAPLTSRPMQSPTDIACMYELDESLFCPTREGL